MEENFKFVTIRREDNVAVITLNRPERLNALQDGLLYEIGTSLDGMRDDNTIRVVIITGAGNGFCSGADLRDYEPGLLEVAAKGAYAIPEKIWKAQYPIRAIINVGKPVIAMVNGISMGGGMDLALACDIRTGCEKTRFMAGFSRVGLIHGMGQLWTLPRIVGFGKAAELIYTCDFVDAEEAYRIGLLNHLWPAAELEPKTLDLARRIANKPPLTIKYNRLLMQRGLSTNLDASLESARITQCITGLSKDRQEAWKAVLEKRPGVFKGE